MQRDTMKFEALPYNSNDINSPRLKSMIVACLFGMGLSACGFADDGEMIQSSGGGIADVATSQAPRNSELVPARLADATSLVEPVSATPADQPVSATPADQPLSATLAGTWLESAIRSMRASNGGFAPNDDKLLHRNTASYASQSERANLVMGRYGTSAAFTSVNPDYQTELSYVSASSPVRYLETWPRLLVWDQLYLGERFGGNHAPGYTGNSRVRTWGYEMWIKSRAGVWRQVFRADGKGAEAWRPTYRGSASFDSYALDLRKEPDGSTSVRPLPALGLDSSGTYWVPHGYAGGVQNVDPHDVADILVLCFSQLVLHDPRGADDRQHARFLFAIGADWYPPKDRTDITFYPSVGASRHSYVTVEPQLHVMHTMTEAELRANPPPR